MHVHGMRKFTEHLIFRTEISQNRKCQCSLWNVKDSKASAQLLSRDFSKKTQVVLDRSSYNLGGQNGLKPLWSHPGERPWYPHLLLLLLLLKGAQMVRGYAQSIDPETCRVSIMMHHLTCQPLIRLARVSLHEEQAVCIMNSVWDGDQGIAVHFFPSIIKV